MQLEVSTDGKIYIEFRNISGNVHYKFPFSGKVVLLKIIGNKEGVYDRFKKIKIGYDTFTNEDSIRHVNPSISIMAKSKTYTFSAYFKHGDEFVFEHNNCTEKVILYLK